MVCVSHVLSPRGTIGIDSVNAKDMWMKSKPGDYTSFRTFIFGITSQSMFPDGVIYEGVSEEALSFRGESGANDSMVYPPMFPHLKKDVANTRPNRSLYAITSLK
jgi:indoleamine 2,3-dioxygenase